MDLTTAFRVAPIYAIFDNQLRGSFSARDVIDAWLRAGIRVIQFRHKEDWDESTLHLCRHLAGFVRERGGLFVVNDRADVAVLVHAHGVHLGQDDLPPQAARRILPENVWIGYSTHNPRQIAAALQMPIDYLAIGPVFVTSSKTNPDPTVGVALVTAARTQRALPLVAIGGISLENVRETREAGADAVAIISGLVSGCETIEAVEQRAKEMLARATSPAQQVPGAS